MNSIKSFQSILYLIALKTKKSVLKCEVWKKEMVQELYVVFQKFLLCNKLVQQQLVDLQFINFKQSLITRNFDF